MNKKAKIIVDTLVAIPLSFILLFLVLTFIGGVSAASLPIQIILTFIVASFFATIPALFVSHLIPLYLWRRFGPNQSARILSIAVASTLNSITIYAIAYSIFSQY